MTGVRSAKILVTGGGGFIGTHVVLGLLREGREVCVVDDFSNSFPQMLDRVAALAQRSCKVCKVDVCDIAALDQAFAEFQPDAVIHLAGLKSVPDSLVRPADYCWVNIGGAASLLKAMQAHGCRRLLFSSTAAVYAEAIGRANLESDPVCPATPYARTKRVIEEMLDSWCAADPDRQAISLRYFNPVGADASGEIGEWAKAEQPTLMSVVIDAASGKRPHVEVFGSKYPTPDGSGMRDFVHVSDLADAHIAALSALIPGHSIFNVGTGIGVTVLGLIDRFQSTVGVDVPVRVVSERDGDLGVSIANPQLIAEVLGWRAKFGVEQMCRSAWNWSQTLKSIKDI